MAKTVFRQYSAVLKKLSKKKLVSGVNIIQSFTVDGKRLKLAVVVRRERIENWTVLDAGGRRVPSETVRVVRAKKKVTCWRCVKDTAGDLHCFMIPCPDIPLPPFGTRAFSAAINRIKL